MNQLKKKRPTKFRQWRRDHRKTVCYPLFPEDMKAIIETPLCTTDALILAIINSSDGNGDCFITTKTLAKMLGKTESTIRDAMCRLRKTGLVRSERAGGKRYLMATKFDPYRVNDMPPEEELNQKLEMSEDVPEESFSFDELPESQDWFEEEDPLSELF